ncbi:MAG: hypothetical protein A3I77_08380 [Gammaproteobacteria bacterium RIFCSPLOWO2_02_FULL_42_14]|nr:MAG: hypothetical protein A3B71_04215 [Gammaproteobacteria bacterium RIFCSPHIGHO2_02_FULL_42_43]OGT52880.1 MAG: hypothetical protein A3E54_07310 [Gammaproteobacteria bacterium RIFCSPHIGHO2_12_FULL_41_25]OGT61347.1 MAG: hypothetical protein A3I77_08380 [Gammaproteobacteria bacterium RIFCSPLOWO2_02_FULL_42_14]OGT87276.1 MAG: hypothetical protein A3G86_02105 [Gammaproteobacteria bacterium RIFCSPLOWO2_12_FULL_42_18]
MRIFLYLFWFILIILVAAFAILNSQIITVHYFIGQADIYFPLLVLGILVIGALIAVIALLPALVRNKVRLHDLKVQMKTLEHKTHE